MSFATADAVSAPVNAANAPINAANAPTDTGNRPLRKDAERNRQLILDVAARAFAERGLDVGFEEIARRAGVGVGTVYRRFPDRELLVEALFERRMDEMAATAQRALDHPDPWAGLCAFLQESLEMQVTDRGMQTVLGANTHGGEGLAAARARVRPLVDAVVARAIESGDLRSDVDPLDLAAFSLMISAATTDSQPDLWRRYLVLMIDALRADRPTPTPLPLQPPDDDDLNDLVQITLGPRPRPQSGSGSG